MKTKLQFYIVLPVSVLLAGTAWADNHQGIYFYRMNQPEIAKKIFLLDLSLNKESAGNCYYLGEIYFSQQKPDSAAFYFNKGLAVDSESALNKVGQGKLLYKTDPQGARKLFKEALSKKNANNLTVLLAVVKALSDNGAPEYLKYLEEAKNKGMNHPDIYLLEGDIALAAGKPGDAAAKYEEAIHFDNTCTEAYLKYARIYGNQNPELAIVMLKKLLEIDPNSVPALKELGGLYYAAGKFSSAAEIYDKYVKLEHAGSPEMIRYALILYYSKDYRYSLRIIEPLLSREPDDLVLNRIAMYDRYELKQYEPALAAARKVMGKPESELIAGDYACYGRLLARQKEWEPARKQLEKALALDTAAVEIWKDLSGIYYNTDRPDKALQCYKTYFSKRADAANTADLFELGRLYLKIGVQADSVKKASYLLPADSLFVRVAAQAPSSFLAYQMRAQANSALDDSEMSAGLAKPYYEKMLELVLPEPEKRRSQIMEGYRYLGVYYLKHDDNEKSKEYWNKILAIDPEDALATQVMGSLKSK